MESVKKWTKEEVEYLKQTYPHKPIAYIAKQLNRSEVSIKNKAQKEKLKFHSAWIDRDVDFLTENFQTLTTRQIADVIKRSPASVSSKARALGLSRLPASKELDSPMPVQAAWKMPKIKQQTWIPLL